MFFKKHKSSIITFAFTLAAGGLGGWLTSLGMEDYAKLSKPPLTPPSIVFPIVWTILFIIMALGASMVWNTGDKGRVQAMYVYVIQLAANVIWSLLFFTLNMRLAAFFWLILLWRLILLMIQTFSRIRPLAGRLQIPYLVWVTFAGYLNLAIWLINR